MPNPSVSRRRPPSIAAAEQRTLLVGAASFVGGTILSVHGTLAAGETLAAGDTIRTDHAQMCEAGRMLIGSAGASRDMLRELDKRQRNMTGKVPTRDLVCEPAPPGTLRQLLLDESRRRTRWTP